MKLTRMLRLARTVLLGFIVIYGGCESGDQNGLTPPGTSTPGAVTSTGSAMSIVGRYIEEAAQAGCEKILSCCSAAEIIAAEMPFATRGACVENWVDYFWSGIDAAAIDRGYKRWNATAARRTLDSLKALTCEKARKNFWPDFYSIQRSDEAAVPLGGICRDSLFCVTGYCAFPTVDGEEQRCAPAKADGATCGEESFPPRLGRRSRECVGDYCTEAGLCAQVKADGASCTIDDECRSFYCAPSGRCEQPGEEPGSGSGSGICERGL